MLPDIIECMMLNKKEEIKYFFLNVSYLENDTKNKSLPQSCIEQIGFES